MLIKHENLGLGKVRVCLGAFLKTVFDLEFFCSWTIRSENAAVNACQGCECSFCLQSFTLWSLGLNFSFVIVFELCWIKIVWCLEKFPCEIFWFWAGFGGRYDECFLCLFWCIWRECTSQTFKEEELSIKILRSLSSPYGVVKNTMEDAELLITQFYHGLNWGLVVLCCCFCSWFFIFGFSYDASCVLLCTICMPIQKYCLNSEVLWQFKILSIMCMYIHCVY